MSRIDFTLFWLFLLYSSEPISIISNKLDLSSQSADLQQKIISKKIDGLIVVSAKTSRQNRAKSAIVCQILFKDDKLTQI